jgi:hypothetical protein
MKHTELNRAVHIFNPWLDSRSIRRQNATRGYSKHSLSLSNSAPSLLRVPQINRTILMSDGKSTKFIAVRKEKKEMSIYESLRTGMNDFGQGDRFKGYPRMPVLNADQPAQIIGLTPPDKRPTAEMLNLAPPFDRFFIECTLPPSLQFNALSLVVAGEANVILKEKVQEIGLDVSIDRSATYTATLSEAADRFNKELPKTHLICQPFYYIKPADDVDPLCMCDFNMYIGLSKDGLPCELPDATPEMLDEIYRRTGKVVYVGEDGVARCILIAHRGVNTPEAWSDAIEAGLDVKAAYRHMIELFASFVPLLYAINSLHHKRTVITTVQHSRQVRRAAQRSNQQPPDQKTIVLKDFVTIIQGAHKARSQGVEYPLCEVIGHFANYGVNGRTGLLFGKYRGTFFVPSFLRGNPDKGAIDHDYVLKAGAAA